MAVLQHDLNAASLRGEKSSLKPKSAAEQKEPAAIDADAQDEQIWEEAFAASQDTLEFLGARSRENRKAGRTKRINP